MNDLRFALRQLRKSPGFTAVAVITLALGIGANAAIFTLVRGVLIKPLVNRDEDRLIYIRQSALGIGNKNSTWSIPEIRDLKARVKTLSAFGDFSSVPFTIIGLGEPREVNGGVVNGSFFEVMGLRPVLGRLVGPKDDGPKAGPVIVLTYRFWSDTLKRDPSVIGKTVHLGSVGEDRSATIIGVLEPSVPYPQETEIIANVSSSPHHLSATMVTERVHRMTELFARLAPGASLDQARAELRSVYAAMKKDHPDAYSKQANFQISAKLLRDQITSGARTVLLVLLAASALVFIVACSNVANLILARTVRREGELAVRTALGASKRALRRMLLAESLLLCGSGAALGVLSAQWMVDILARYASRFSVRALNLTVDSSLLWVGVALAIVAAVILAFVPRLPADTSGALHLSSGSVQLTGSRSRQRIFVVTQIAASFVAPACCSLHSSHCKEHRAGWTRVMSLPSTFPRYFTERQADRLSIFTRKLSVALMRFQVSMRPLSGWSPRGAMPAPVPPCNSAPMVTFAARAKRTRARSFVLSLLGSLARSAFPSLRDATSMSSTVKATNASQSSAKPLQSACSPIRTRSIGTYSGPIPS